MIFESIKNLRVGKMMRENKEGNMSYYYRS